MSSITVTPTFENYNSMFEKQHLAIYKANYLLNNFRDNHNKEQIKEIERELKSSLLIAQNLFNNMLAIGIPENMLSHHLQPEL